MVTCPQKEVRGKSLGQRTRKHLRLIRRISVQYVAKSNIQTEFALVKMMDIRGER